MKNMGGVHAVQSTLLVHSRDDSVMRQSDHAAVGRRILDPSEGKLVVNDPPPGTAGPGASEIDISRSSRFAYGPDRGHNSIGVFAVEQTSGCFTPAERTFSQGKGPRFMAVEPSGACLDAANENSDTVVTSKVDEGTGKLSATGQVLQTGSPGSMGFST